MIMDKSLNMFEKSLKLWGVDAQISMFVEESGEAIVAASHVRRANRCNPEVMVEFAEEIGDLRFMSAEMVHIFKSTTIRLTDKQVEKMGKVGVQITDGDRTMSFGDALALFHKVKTVRLEQLITLEGGALNE